MASPLTPDQPVPYADTRIAQDGTMRRSLVALVLMALLPLLLFGGGVAWLLVDQRRAAVEAELSATVRALRVAVDRELAGQAAAVEQVATSTTLRSADLTAFRDRARQLLEVHPDWLNLVLIEPINHSIEFSASPLSPVSVLPASLVEVVESAARAGRTRNAGLQPAGWAAGRPTVLLLAPVAEDDRVPRVIGVALDPARFSAMFAAQGLDRQWTGAVLDDQMVIVGRSHDAERFVGRVATPTLARQITAQASGLFTALNQEGQRVHTLVSRSDKTGWAVAIGVPGDVVDQPLQSLWIQLTLAAATLIAFSLALTGRIGLGIIRRRNAYESALRESGARLDAALAGAEMASWDLHVPTGEVTNDDRWARMLGYRQDELPARLTERWMALVHPDDLPSVMKTLDSHIQGERASFEAEYRLRHRDGHWVWVLARGKVVEHGAHGLPLRVMGTALDISDRKSAAIEAEHERVRVQTILETAREGFHIVDSNGLLVDANPAFLQMLGHDRSAIGVLKVSDWDVDESVEQFKAKNAALLAGATTRRFEARHRHRDGHVLDVEVSAARMDLDGQHLICAASRDITERKQVEAELASHRENLEGLVADRTAELAAARDAAQSANRAKSTFLANMSHELRTPLNAIMGMTELALRRATDPRQTQQLHTALGSARHLLTILNDILDASKFEADALTLQYRDFQLSSVFAEATRQTADAARFKGLRIDRSIDSRIPDLLHGDSERLTQMLVNLLGNAVKFSDEGRIEVRAEWLAEDAMGLLIRLSVSDQGSGLSTEEQAGLFQPFVQTDASLTRVHGGLGLGLSIVRRLARLMEGDAGVRSEPGFGSTFWATVRLERGHDPRSDLKVEDPLLALRRDHAGTHVLLVDDNPVNREVTSTLLASAELRVTTAANGPQCLELLRDQAFALVLMDVQMPGLTGIETTRAIRAVPGLSGIPIVAMTSSIAETDRQACLAAGMNGILLKPVEASVLYAKVLKWLRRGRS